jgi:hypothetical protein
MRVCLRKFRLFFFADGEVQKESFMTMVDWLGKLTAAGILAIAVLSATPAACQTTLYNNGPDGDVGYYHVNFGSAVANSFVLTQPAMLTGVTLTLYSVDDSNHPQHLKWTITTEAFGGAVKGSGFVDLSLLGSAYLTKFLFYAWEEGFALPNLDLPAGTYYLQIQDVVTQWDTWAFWAQSSDGNSQGYYRAISQNGAGTVSLVPSETFSVLGEWQPQRAN